MNCNKYCFAGITYSNDSILNVNYIDNKKEGNGQLISKNGIVLADLSFQQDLLNGYCIFYNENGKKLKECVFENGIENGKGKEYEDDKMIFEGIYKNGNRYSSLEVYEEEPSYYVEKKDGKTLSICKFNENHLKDGICYEYDNDIMSEIVLYENGIKKRVMNHFINDNEMIEYNDNERMIYKGEYFGNVKNGYKRNGNGMSYYDNGRTVYEGEFKDGKWNGSGVMYYENGNKKYEGEWKDGKPNGSGVGYYDNGNVRYEGE